MEKLDIAELEEVADEVEVPISEETLTEIKAVGDHSRKRVIPLVSSL